MLWFTMWLACTGTTDDTESSVFAGFDSSTFVGTTDGSTPTTPTVSSPDTGMAPQVPDFALNDRNPTSDTFDELVSPRDQIGRVSVWYFGHST